MNKKSFVLYTDQKEIVDELDDEQAGKLFKAIYEYNTTEKVSLTGILKSVFTSFKITFDRDEKKWKEIRQKRSEAGKRGMESRWGKDSSDITNDNKSYQTLTKITDSVSVSVSDSVSGSVGDRDIPGSILDDTFPPLPTNTPTLSELRSFCDSNGMSQFDCEYFYNYYEANGWTNKNGTKVKNWKARVKNWYADDVKNGKIKIIDTSRRLE